MHEDWAGRDLAAEARAWMDREMKKFRDEIAAMQAEIEAEVTACRIEAEQAMERARQQVASAHGDRLSFRLQEPGLAVDHRPRYRARAIFYDGSHRHFYSNDGYLFYEHHLPEPGRPEPRMFTRETLEDGTLSMPAISVAFAEYRPRRPLQLIKNPS